MASIALFELEVQLRDENENLSEVIFEIFKNVRPSNNVVFSTGEVEPDDGVEEESIHIVKSEGKVVELQRRTITISKHINSTHQDLLDGLNDVIDELYESELYFFVKGISLSSQDF